MVVVVVAAAAVDDDNDGGEAEEFMVKLLLLLLFVANLFGGPMSRSLPLAQPLEPDRSSGAGPGSFISLLKASRFLEISR